MKILVTGSNGFLGTALVERLIAHGERDIRCFVRPGSDQTRLEAVLNKRGDHEARCHSERSEESAFASQAQPEVFTGSLATI